MPDLLVQPHPPPNLRHSLAKDPASQGHKSAPGSNSKDAVEYGPLGALFHTLKDAGNLWYWWKDGTTRQTREASRQIDESRQILYLRMKGVRPRPSLNLLTESIATH
jgi:TAG lipase/steryl ester hydrolase/phospholipase A2/LPA acyltransferase